MSEIYHSFAAVYDKFMNNIPYREWSDYLIRLLEAYNITSGNLLELGCGTANLSILMAEKGFKITGIDSSVDMLTVAADKIHGRDDIFLIEQDMTKLELLERYDSVYSLCDCMNYLLSDEDIIHTFQGVKKYLSSEGVFIFDMKTEFFYRDILGDNIFCDHQETCSYTWENSYFEDERINQYELNIFVKQPSGDLYRHFYEVHHQRAYTLPHIIHLLSKSGLIYLTSFDAFTTAPPSEESERIYIIAGKGE